MESWKFNVRISHVDRPDGYTKFRAFAGTVEILDEALIDRDIEPWKGKHVLGWYTKHLNSK